MQSFNRRAFWYTFGIAVSMSFAVLLAVIVTQGMFTPLNVLLAIILSSGIAVVSAALIASYRYAIRWSLAAFRSVMRRIAKSAVRASLSHAMTRVGCSGILEIDGGIGLKVQVGKSHGINEGSRFSVYEGTNNERWGGVVAVDVGDCYCDCVPYDRENTVFWEKLEDRMKSDTSPPPHVYLVRDVEETKLIEAISELLDNWR